MCTAPLNADSISRYYPVLSVYPRMRRYPGVSGCCQPEVRQLTDDHPYIVRTETNEKVGENASLHSSSVGNQSKPASNSTFHGSGQ